VKGAKEDNNCNKLDEPMGDGVLHSTNDMQARLFPQTDRK